jgi:hypothetical protein
MPVPLSRRHLLELSVLAACGAGVYGVVRAVQHVRRAARQLSDV